MRTRDRNILVLKPLDIPRLTLSFLPLPSRERIRGEGRLHWRDRDLHPVVYERLPRMQGVRMGPIRARAGGWLGRGLSVLALPLLLTACQSTGGKDTIAKLRTMQIEIKEEKIEGGLEKAMEGYRRFLEQTPDSALSPEAIRRLADLKVEREYGLLSGDTAAERRASGAALPAPERAARPDVARTGPPVSAPAQ